MAGRILGMGDVLTLIDRAEQAIEKRASRKGSGQNAQGRLALDDFLEQLQMVKKMGPISGLIGMLPAAQGSPQRCSGRLDAQALRGHHPLDDT